MKYNKVNVAKYVKEGLQSGILVPMMAEKFARVIARRGILGETVISWSVDENGNEIQEKVSQVTLDEYTKKTGWVVTKVDENGNIIMDSNGHCNQWIVDDTTFNRKYEIDNNNSSLFKPKGGIQIFVQISDNIILSQWGSDMKIAAGGYINITDESDMYGISHRDFNETYRFINENKIKIRHK